MVPKKKTISIFRKILYQTKKGSFFLKGDGGAMSIYNKLVGNATCGDLRLIPMDEQEVIQWLERTENYDTLETLFPDAIEDA